MVASRRSKAPPRRDFAVPAHPCEQELITSFLSPRLISGDRSCEFIHDADVYAAHPADLTREHAAAVASNGEEAWYFFTAVRAKGGGRRARTVDSGEGWWHSEAGSKPVVATHRGRVGHRQSFSFVTKEDGQRVRSGWLMVELGLDGDGHDELALCKVYFSPRAAKNKKPAAAATPSSASGRKRKAADDNDGVPDDASTPPARQPRRRARRLTPEADTEVVDDDPVDEDETLAGEQEGKLHEKNSAADDEVHEDPAIFSWWLRNESSMMALMGMNEAELEQSSSTEVVVEGPPEIRLEPPDAWPEWPRSPIVRDENYRVCMWLTYDEMYDLPEVREFLKPTLQLQPPLPPSVPGEAEINPNLQPVDG